MARMHTRRRGQSGSKRPFISESPAWVPLGGKEVEAKVVELGNQKLSTSLIGIRLRDEYAVPNVRLLTGKTITQILEEHKLMPERPEEIQNLIKKVVSLQSHLEHNRKDLHNVHALQMIEAKIRRLVKYYKRMGKLPQDFEYTLEGAKLLLE